MSVWAILQARVSSTRLPGKVLTVVEGRTVLEWVVRAVRATPGVDDVCVAIPEGAEQDPLVAEARALSVKVVRGSELDVLSRFAKAAAETDASVIMRVTTDCPFSDPAINEKVLNLLVTSEADYACNNEVFSFPHGLDCEVFTRGALERANAEATDPYDREHVTPWMKRAPDICRRNLLGPGGDPAKWRLTVDYPEDIIFFKALAARLGDDLCHSERVAETLLAHPYLHAINDARRQR